MNKRLYRSRKDVFLSGVCGGIAEYFNVDVSLVRIGWVIATLATSGLGLIAYIIAAVVVPVEPSGGVDYMDTEPQNSSETKTNSGTEQKPRENPSSYSGWTDSNGWNKDSGTNRKYLGLFLILLGVFFIVKRYIPSIDFGMLWAVCLVLAGFVIMTKRR